MDYVRDRPQERLYIVGKLRAKIADNETGETFTCWDLIGVFNDHERALQCCQKSNHFIVNIRKNGLAINGRAFSEYPVDESHELITNWN